jgi:hypothetical protein
VLLAGVSVAHSKNSADLNGGLVRPVEATELALLKPWHGQVQGK